MSSGDGVNASPEVMAFRNGAKPERGCAGIAAREAAQHDQFGDQSPNRAILNPVGRDAGEERAQIMDRSCKGVLDRFASVNPCQDGFHQICEPPVKGGVQTGHNHVGPTGSVSGHGR